MENRSNEVEVGQLYMSPSITVTLNKADIDDEVAKATDYTGSKLINGDELARQRILMSDEDQKTLTRFWHEAIAVISERLKEIVNSISENESGVQVTLIVSKAYDTALNASVESNLRSYAIAFIVGQWFKFCNKDEATSYLAQATSLLENAERILYSRRRPKPPFKVSEMQPIV